MLIHHWWLGDSLDFYMNSLRLYRLLKRLTPNRGQWWGDKMSKSPYSPTMVLQLGGIPRVLLLSCRVIFNSFDHPSHCVKLGGHNQDIKNLRDHHPPEIVTQMLFENIPIYFFNIFVFLYLIIYCQLLGAPCI